MQVAPPGGYYNLCKCHLVAKFATYAAGATWCPNPTPRIQKFEKYKNTKNGRPDLKRAGRTELSCPSLQWALPYSNRKLMCFNKERNIKVCRISSLISLTNSN